MKNRMRKIVVWLLCAGIIVGNTVVTYAENNQGQTQEQSVVVQDEETDSTSKDIVTDNENDTESIGNNKKEDEHDTTENQDSSTLLDEQGENLDDGTDRASEFVSMDGQRETDELYGMDENGNIYIRDENEIAAFPVDEIGTQEARKSTIKIVNFRANKAGNTITSHSTTNYTEYNTGTSGYVCGAYGADAAYLGTTNGKVKFMLSGVVGLVDEGDVQVVDFSLAKSYSCYYVNGDSLVHRICTNMTTSGWGSSILVGIAPSYLNSGSTYYSYDGHYFYTDYRKMIFDYQSDTRNNALNASNPYYNYYQYLPERSSSNYSGNDLNTLLSSQSKVNSSSKMYNTGSNFVKYQNTYGVNALLMIGVAANESNWGTSSISKTKNNLFGINAVDSNTSQANSFSSVDTCIKDFSETYMSKRYLRAGYTYYHGAFFGDKASGINVSYASDPYWGEKAAAVAWSLDKTGGYKDKEKYTIGIKNIISTGHTNVNVRKEPTTSSTALYQTGNYSNYAVLIRGEKNGFYEIQSDPVLNNGRTGINTTSGNYNTDSMYVYISKDYITAVSTGNTTIVDDTEGVDYFVHAQTYGWMSKVSDGESAGTVGEAKRLECLKISLRNPISIRRVRYKVHCQTYGWRVGQKMEKRQEQLMRQSD